MNICDKHALTLKIALIYRVSQRKSMVQQIINILRMVKHSDVIFSDIRNTTCIKLCVKFKFSMSNVTKVMALRRVIRTYDYQTTSLHTSIFYHISPFLPIIPLTVITLVTFITFVVLYCNQLVFQF